ncbi:MAG: glycoside hydrolase family 32 protein [Spirochaetes bacterium]|nr:glycoside hydrolase family 32 protein [Spirochaetota bacterium]MBU0954215.1 glycoside hydrolase family 32 protein [Spirochaetota bacterium]
MYRHRYHLSAPQGWLNDPNGFCYYKGRYHLFYQHNPHRPVWGRMYWGHASSLDLVKWRHEPVALKPRGFWEAFLGCFSGSAVEKDGKLYLMYTGFSFLGQVQLLAETEDGMHFRKRRKPVLGPLQRPPGADWLNFRDPKVFTEQATVDGSASCGKGDYLCLLGSSCYFRRRGTLFSRRQRGGQVWLYRSTDLVHWTRVASLLRSPLTKPGIFECPDFVRLDGQDLLLVSPMFLPTNERDEFENLHSVAAIPGKLDSSGFTPSVAAADSGAG